MRIIPWGLILIKSKATLALTSMGDESPPYLSPIWSGSIAFSTKLNFKFKARFLHPFTPRWTFLLVFFRCFDLNWSSLQSKTDTYTSTYTSWLESELRKSSYRSHNTSNTFSILSPIVIPGLIDSFRALHAIEFVPAADFQNNPFWWWTAIRRDET